MVNDEAAQKIRSMIPSTPTVVVMGRRGAQIVAQEESKDLMGNPQARLDFSDSQTNTLYRAMYSDIEMFLNMQSQSFESEAMNVAESLSI